MQRKDWFENWLRSKIGYDTPLPQPDLTWQKIQQRRERRRRRVLFLWLFGRLGFAASAGWVGYFYFQNFEKMEVAARPVQPIAADFSQSQNSQLAEKEVFDSEKSQNPKPNEVSRWKRLPEQSPEFDLTSKSKSQKNWGRGFQPDTSLGLGFQHFSESNFASPIEETPAQSNPDLQVGKPHAAPTGRSGVQKIPTPICMVSAPQRAVPLEPPPPDTLKLKLKFKLEMDWQKQVPFQISTELSGGYGSNFLLQQSSQIRDWQDLRQRQETPLDAVSAQFLLRADLGKRLFVASGIGFWQWTDRRRSGQLDSSFSKIIAGQVVKIIRYADGTEEKILSDTVQATVNHRSTAIEYNRYRRFEIPVAVGWRFFPSKKWSVETSAGVAFGFRTPSSGWVAGKNLQGKVSLKNNIYLQRGTLASFGRVALTRNFGKTAVGAGVQGRWEFRNMGRVASELLETRASVGLNFSVRRRF